MLDQSPPHPATRLLLWKSISCVSQAASCRVCYGMASAPAPAGSPISVWFYQTLSLLSLAVWNKGSSVRSAESFSDWTASVYVHGSHRKNKVCCSLLELGPPRCFSLSFCLFSPFFLWVLTLHLDQCRSHLICWIKWWHPSELVYICASSLFLLQPWKLHIWSPPIFPVLFPIWTTHPLIPNTPHTFCLFLPKPQGLIQVPRLPQSLLDLPSSLLLLFS